MNVLTLFVDITDHEVSLTLLKSP